MAVITNFGVPVAGVEAGATLMPKLQYRFRVEFSDLGAAKDPQLVTRNVVNVSRPSLSHEEVTVDTYNSKIYLAGKHTWESINLVLRDDVDSEVIKQLGNQMSKQVNHAGQTSTLSGKDYKFNMTISTLDGSQASGESSVIDQWELVGCFIQNIQYGELNYGTSDVVQVTCTIRYDNASNTINGTDALSSVGTQHEAGASTRDAGN